MATEYQYGAYGHVSETVVKSADQTGTVPVYVGTVPVNLVRGYAESGVINMPVKISNMNDAQRKVGYSADWDSFSLCEALAAHFDNSLGNIGPVYLINVLDPDMHVKSKPTTKTLIFNAGRCEFKSSTIVLDTLLLADKMEGLDFRVEYNFKKGSVVVTSADLSNPITGTVVATFNEVDPSKVTEDHIIGSASSAGSYTGLGAIALVYMEHNAIVNLIAAPGWSGRPAVYEEMVERAKDINGHWDAFVVADIPLQDNNQQITTMDQALAWQKAHGYNSDYSKVCWPMGIDPNDRVFHLSTFVVVEYMRVDATHGSVPMETCANKPIPIIRQYFGKDSTSRGFDQQSGNTLTQKGITTTVKWGGQWVLWGDHTAAYDYSVEGDPRAIFDVYMRMLMHITNNFQREWSPEIDRPMSRALRDRIINREQEKLDTLVSMGALIGQPRIVFEETENTTADMMLGDFQWDIPVTPTPPTKSVSVYVAYTDEGFNSYFEGGE